MCTHAPQTNHTHSVITQARTDDTQPQCQWLPKHKTNDTRVAHEQIKNIHNTHSWLPKHKTNDTDTHKDDGNPSTHKQTRYTHRELDTKLDKTA